MEQTVQPHVLRNGAEVAVATVDGVGALIVPVSEELAHRLTFVIDGVEAHAVTIEEIEELCAEYGVATVVLYGLDDGGGLDVVSVEVVGMVLTRDHD
jgi:hypothetical protein